jgi:hypothetical protein
MDKEKPKEKPLIFCPLCAKNQPDELQGQETVEVDNQVLKVDMCPKCAVVVHNLFRIIASAIKQRVAEQSKLVDLSGRRLS